jgi:hypothetical protein
MDLGTAGPDVARAIVKDCPDMIKIGVQVMEIAKLNLNLTDEDQARIDQFQDQIVQAKIDARKARIAVSQAEAQAQARQFQLDQDYMNRARYLQNMDMPSYQQYAGAEAMIGMGQGMAQPGAAGGAGLAGAGMMAGVGMGAAMAGVGRGFPPPGYPPPGYPPPGYPPPGYPPPGYGQAYPQPPGYPPQGYPAGPQGAPQGMPQQPPQQPAAPQAAPSPGAPVANACRRCGAANPGGAKFCTECGSPFA